jgi:hypothetical protein
LSSEAGKVAGGEPKPAKEEAVKPPVVEPKPAKEEAAKGEDKE